MKRGEVAAALAALITVGCRTPSSVPAARASAPLASATAPTDETASVEPPNEDAARAVAETTPAREALYSGRYRRRDVIATAIQRSDAGSDPEFEWSIARWPAHRGDLVALAYRRVSAPDIGRISPRLFLLRNDASGLVRVAEGAVVINNAECTHGPIVSDYGEAPTMSLDLAPYDVASGIRAIGVRLSCFSIYGTGEGPETYLYLLAAIGNALQPIFSCIVEASTPDRLALAVFTMSAVVIVQKVAHRGFFDLLVKRTERADPFPESKKKKSEVNVRLEQYLWNGHEYQPEHRSTRLSLCE